MSHSQERPSSFRFKYVWREDVLFTSTFWMWNLCETKTTSDFARQNPKAGQKPLVNEGKKFGVSGDFFFYFGVTWGWVLWADVGFCVLFIFRHYFYCSPKSVYDILKCLQFSASYSLSCLYFPAKTDQVSWWKGGEKYVAAAFAWAHQKLPVPLFPEIAFLQSKSSLI